MTRFSAVLQSTATATLLIAAIVSDTTATASVFANVAPQPSPASSIAAQPSSPASPPPAASDQSYQALVNAEAALEQLDPANPRRYFETAEEVMRIDTANADSAVALRRLTQQALVIGLESWRTGPARLDDPRLGPSILLALAAVEIDPQSERARWLRVLAAAVDAQGLISASDGEVVATSAKFDDAAVIDVLSALELLRAGEGRRASKLLERPEVFDLLRTYERLLHPAGFSGEADRIRRLAAEWPICSQCRNRRSVKDSTGVFLCPTCRGDPGPTFSDTEVLYQLRLEATLLSGAQQSWVSQTLVDAGRPLRDLDAAEVAPTLNIDPALSIRRNGVWLKPNPSRTATQPGGRSSP